MAPEALKLLAIGVDGLSFAVIRPWLEEGLLPNLAALLDRGSSGILCSTMPPLTPPSWYASLTGMNPGGQNIFGFFRAPRERYAKVPVTGADLRATAIWDHLGLAGKESLILYLPMSYPPRHIRGVMVSGFMTPDGAADYAWPPEVRGEIERAVPGFKLNLDHNAIRLGQLDRFYLEAGQVLRAQVQAAVHLMGTRPWDFCFVHLHDVDSVTHLFFKYQDPGHPAYRPGGPHADRLRDYYRSVDEAVGILAAAAGSDAALLLWSDHGFMPARRFFSVNRWLVKQGYLRLKGRGRLRLKSALASLGLGKERLRWWARRLGLAGLARRLPASVKQAVPQTRFSFNDLAAHVDWPRSKAFFLSASEGSLYANIKGRESAGCLSENEAGGVLEEIRDRLLAERDPETGVLVLAGAWLGRDLYRGPHAANGPDLVLLPAYGWYFSENAFGPPVGDQGMESHQISATHHPDGVLAAVGGPFRAGVMPREAYVWDVTPTVLRALDAPLPPGLDGRVLEELFDPRFLVAHPPRQPQGEIEGRVGAGDAGNIPPEEMKKIIGNLEGLGYF